MKKIFGWLGGAAIILVAALIGKVIGHTGYHVAASAMQPSLSSDLQNMVAGLNIQLPKVVDSYTTVTSASVSGEIIIYRNSLNVAVDKTRINTIGNEIKIQNRASTCQTLLPILARGGKAIYFYTDTVGSTFSWSLAASDCHFN